MNLLCFSYKIQEFLIITFKSDLLFFFHFLLLFFLSSPPQQSCCFLSVLSSSNVIVNQPSSCLHSSGSFHNALIKYNNNNKLSPLLCLNHQHFFWSGFASKPCSLSSCPALQNFTAGSSLPSPFPPLHPCSFSFFTIFTPEYLTVPSTEKVILKFRYSSLKSLCS